ncbi:MAG: phosphate acyltransferase, partial [Paludibacter sp.]|nr:phosphate acyltransferase [Paludibacter sp.]
MGFVSTQIIGNPEDYDIQSFEKQQGIQFIDCSDLVAASTMAVEMVKTNDADILIFPSFVSANIFYKSIVTFAHAEIGGMLFGTEKPVVLTSRSDSAAT